MTAPATTVEQIRRRLSVFGRVQGVGFRPFVYRLAQQEGVRGFVRNDPGGAVIEAQGEPVTVDRFIRRVLSEPPTQAHLRESAVALLQTVRDEAGFRIEASKRASVARAEVAADLAVCPDCLRELSDPTDRRHGYGLTNCTCCGPRYSIIQRVPYDRPNTSMARFELCDDCRREYEAPADRRFHAQPVACPACGPVVRLMDGNGKAVPGDPYATAGAILRCGQILAVKGVGGYHLAVRADDEAAVASLRERKHRLAKPLAVMVRTVAEALKLVVPSKAALLAMKSPAAPIVLCRRRDDAPIAASVAPAQTRLGVMLAYTPIHHLLFDHLSNVPAVVMTSANDSDEPLIYRDEDAMQQLGPLCNAILTHDRPIVRPVDDSVVIDTGGHAAMFPIRRSRGYAPSPVSLPDELSAASDGICLGAELKSTIAVVRDGHVVLSQHLGDLKHSRSFRLLKDTVRDLIDLFGIQPKWIAHDLHPAYLSTHLAQELSRQFAVPLVGIQHHHAHAAAVLAENGFTDHALAIICDGTGYGTDGTTWGGELLACDLTQFRRIAHLQPIRLPGGDAAAKSPWRSAMALLYNAFGRDFFYHAACREVCRNDNDRVFIGRMIESGASCATASSAGRLFDGVAALLGICSENRFDAEASMALESAATDAADDVDAETFDLIEIADAVDCMQLDPSPLVRHLVAERRQHVPVEALAARFHYEFADAWTRAAVAASQLTGLKTIALSGGTMCNTLLVHLLRHRLERAGFSVLTHRDVPPNDGGIAYGQAAIAAARGAA